MNASNPPSIHPMSGETGQNRCYQSLSEEQIKRIHQASCEILSKTGVRFHHPEAIALFQKAGAEILDTSLVRIPTKLVENALNTAPENIPIFDQNGTPALQVGGCRNYYGPGSDCLFIYDLDSGERRKAVLEDVIRGVRLVNSLPNLDFVMSMYLPSDVPEDQYERHQMAVMLRESSKPIIFVGLQETSTIWAIKMASVVAGGAEQLEKQPFIVNYVNTVSAFQHNRSSVARLLYAAERNIPTIYAPGKHRGMTSPITQAGALALGSAGQLAGLVLSQLKREGSPFIISNPGHGTLDMRTMLGLYNAPDDGPYGWDIARHYRP
jgi:trimethylamine--corrinoid protein Co-methyltransferase